MAGGIVTVPEAGATLAILVCDRTSHLLLKSLAVETVLINMGRNRDLDLAFELMSGNL